MSESKKKLMMLANASEGPGKLPRGIYEQTEPGEKHT